MNLGLLDSSVLTSLKTFMSYLTHELDASEGCVIKYKNNSFYPVLNYDLNTDIHENELANNTPESE